MWALGMPLGTVIPRGAKGEVHYCTAMQHRGLRLHGLLAEAMS